MDRNQKDTTINSPKRKHQNTVSAWKISNSKDFKTENNYYLTCDRHEFDIIHFLIECEGTRKMEMMLFPEDTDQIRRKLLLFKIHKTVEITGRKQLRFANDRENHSRQTIQITTRYLIFPTTNHVPTRLPEVPLRSEAQRGDCTTSQQDRLHYRVAFQNTFSLGG